MPIDLNAPEIKEAIEAAVEEATMALKEKNSQLIAEKRKLSKGQSIDPDEFQATKDALDKAQSDVKSLQSKYDKDVKNAQTALETEQRANHSLLADRGLSDALVKAGVAPQYLEFVKARYMGQVKVVADGDGRKAVVGDKPVDAFVTEWAKGEEAKHFIKAPANHGGSAQGGAANGAEGKKTMTREAFNALDPAQQRAFSMERGTLTDS